MVDWIKFPNNKPRLSGVVLCLSPTVGATLAEYSVERETFANLHYCCIRDVQYFIEIPDHSKDFHFANPTIELVNRII